MVAAAREAERAGHARITGIWSHFACADMPGHASDRRPSSARSGRPSTLAERAGAEPEVRHLANTPATLTLPESYFDLVRPGGAIVGLSTLPGGAPDWLRPGDDGARPADPDQAGARRFGGVLRAPLRHPAARPPSGVVPLGYNEGIPRLATNTAQVSVRGRRFTIAGTVNMNHIMLDLGDLPAEAGDEVILFGPGDSGEPTAQEWADALGTLVLRDRDPVHRQDSAKLLAG